MKLRYFHGLGLLVAVAMLIPAGPALGAQAPQRNVNWTEATPIPFGATRFDVAVDPSTKRAYFLGFRDVNNNTSGEVWYYDIVAKTYNDTGVAMPVPVSNYTVARLNDPNGLGFYIFGGRSQAGLIIRDTQVYYPATNTAVDVASDPYPAQSPSGCVPLPAQGVAVVSGKAYVMGGSAFSSGGCVTDEDSAQVWRFNPMGTAGNRWKKQPSLNVARGYVTAGVLGSEIYAIGGDNNVAGSLFPVATVESWKPGDNSWDDAGVADLPQACDESQAFGFTKGPLHDTITLAGCGQWPNALADVLQYDDTTNSWSIVGALNEARRNQAGANIGSNKHPKLFVLGGYDATGGVTLASTEIGKPAKVGGPVAPSRPSSVAGHPSTN